jgi:CBS domain-containing membrane protein
MGRMTWNIPHSIRRLLLADTPSLSMPERVRATLGALLAVVVCGGILRLVPLPAYWLVAPVGASVVILFTLSHSPLAQPWPVIGAYAVSTLAGLVSMQFVADPIVAAAVAVALTVWLMTRLNCIHPPGGALAMLLVHEQHGHMVPVGHTLALIALNVLVLLVVAVVINNVVLGRQYPFRGQAPVLSRHATDDVQPMQRAGLEHEDLAGAVRQLGIFVDVKSDELVQLYNVAVSNAFNRHVGLSCGDIMSRDVISVAFATELEEAWNLLRRHKIKALPVLDNTKRLVGILTVADFLRQMDDTTAAGMAVALQGFLRRTPGLNSDKAEVVGQIMSEQVHAVREDTPVLTLIQTFADKGLHHVPVLDNSRRVVGIVTHSDVTAALYRRLALMPAS